MDLSIIIVNYRSWKSLGECLEELSTLSGPGFEFEVIVIDNNSGDNVLEKFRNKYSSFFNFEENMRNGGFANGCNLGASKAKGDYLLFLNPDTVATGSAIRGLLERTKQKPEYSLLSCRQVNASGRESRAYGNFLSPGMLTGTGRAIARIIKGGKLLPKSSGNTIFPDWVSGSVIMINRKLFKELGGFDEAYWMYYEDMDLSRRARDKGGEIVFFTDITIKHNHGGSSRINLYTTSLTKTEVLISRHVYIHKHFSGASKWLSQFYLVVHILITGLIGAAAGIVFFFIPKLYVRFLIFIRITRYYLGTLKRMSWISPHSVLSH